MLLWTSTRARHPAAERANPLADLGAWPMIGDAVKVRQPREGDLRAFVLGLDDETLTRQGWTDDHLLSFAAMARGATSPDGLQLAIEDAATGEVVGFVAIALAGATPSLGWWINKDHRRRGHASDAVAVVLEHLHERGYDAIAIGTAADNTAVQRIADKVGAVELRRGDHTLPNGLAVTSVWYEHRAGPPR